jgi:hypothetical protein
MTNNQPGWKDHNWVYVSARYTNILESFRRFGWVPPTKIKNKV